MKETWQQKLFAGGMLADPSLGSAAGHSLAQQLAQYINTPNTTVYDKAIDSVYLHTHTGGSQLHHLVDGQHDIFGAFDAAAKALPNDSTWQEVMGTAQHLGKDLFSVSGLPVVSLEPSQYQAMSTWMNEHLNVPKNWLGDLLQINGLELFSGVLSVVAVIVGCKQADVKQLAELSAASGLAGILTANPIGLCAAAIALVLAWKQRGNNAELGKGLLVGAGTAGAAMAAGTTVIGILGGGFLPAIGGIILSVVVGLYARRFLTGKLYATTRSNQKPQQQSELPFPKLTQAQIDTWRAMQSYTYPMSNDVRQMLKNAISAR